MIINSQTGNESQKVMKGIVDKAVLKEMKAILFGKVLKGIIAWTIMKGIFHTAGTERNENLDGIEIHILMKGTLIGCIMKEIITWMVLKPMW